MFYSLPGDLPSKFEDLRQTVMSRDKWNELCEQRKPPKWTDFDKDGKPIVTRPRRSARSASTRKGDERSLRRAELRRTLRGRSTMTWPPPSDVPHGDVHVYTDGSSTVKEGRRRAGCGVWFADDSRLNISTRPTGRQTAARAELYAVVLGLRRALLWPTLYRSVTVFTDNRLCVDGVNLWMDKWRADGWTRAGRYLQNEDLWRTLDNVLTEYKSKGIHVRVKHVPAHVGIYGNEKADRLAGTATRRAHRNAALSPAEREDRNLDTMADLIVTNLC